jgi:hypothetical protein
MCDDGDVPELEGSVLDAARAVSGGGDCDVRDVHSTDEIRCLSSATPSSMPVSEDDEDRSTERSVNDGAAADCGVHSSCDDAGGDRANVVDFTAAVTRLGSRTHWKVHSNELGELGVDRNEHSGDGVDRSVVPNREMYVLLQTAYDFLKDELFEGRLPNCLITLQRQRSSYAYFCAGRFRRKDGKRTDEIALNPQYGSVLSKRADDDARHRCASGQGSNWPEDPSRGHSGRGYRRQRGVQRSSRR